MLSINDLRFMYHWSKGEKALRKGDKHKYEEHRNEANKLLRIKRKMES